MKMKKMICILAVTMIAVSMCSCGVSKKDYEAVVAEKDAVIAEREAAVAEVESVKAEMESAAAKAEQDLKAADESYAALESEYSAYKESMEIFEGVEEAEAKARIAKAEQESESIEESKAEKKKQEEAAAKAKAEEESRQAEEKAKKGYDTGITYDQLARNPEDYKAEKVKFKGKVLQVIEGDDEIQIRLAVNSNYDTVILCGYDPDIVSSRILEDDIITVYGTSIGTISYQSTMGGKITIPAMYVDKIDQ